MHAILVVLKLSWKLFQKSQEKKPHSKLRSWIFSPSKTEQCIVMPTPCKETEIKSSERMLREWPFPGASETFLDLTGVQCPDQDILVLKCPMDPGHFSVGKLELFN